jgi:hypothetical protein
MRACAPNVDRTSIEAWRRLVSGLVLVALAACSSALRIERHVVIYPYHIERTAQSRFTTELRLPGLPFVVAGGRASLLVKEDGRLLSGSPGACRSAARGICVPIAVSDGSDPRSNGRFYHLVYAIGIAPLVSALLALAGFVLAAIGGEQLAVARGARPYPSGRAGESGTSNGMPACDAVNMSTP